METENAHDENNSIHENEVNVEPFAQVELNNADSK